MAKGIEGKYALEELIILGDKAVALAKQYRPQSTDAMDSDKKRRSSSLPLVL